MYGYGFSEKKLGDMRDSRVREEFVTSLALDPHNLILAEQVHGGQVAYVTIKDKGREIPDVDGLVTKDASVVLGVRVADCVPLLFVDPHTRVIGTAHAGWRGTVAKISEHMINSMKSLGATPKDIVVFIGPHIGMCCYSVPSDRAQRFLDTFGKDSKVALLREGTWHLDIGYANFLTLVDCGITPSHIHFSPSCTSCQVTTFFSYRKDTKKNFGEMLGVIGWKQ